MRSHSFSPSLNLQHLGHLNSRHKFSFPRFDLVSPRHRSHTFHGVKVNGSKVRKRRYRLLLDRNLHVKAFDEDFGFYSLDNWSDNERSAAAYLVSSSDDDSDGEIMVNPVTDIDLPTTSVSSDEALRVSSHRLAMMGRARNRHRIKLGLFNNLGLITFLTVLLLFVDCCAWKIVRLPLAPFYMTRPFFISAVLVSCAGYICVPMLKTLKIRQIIRVEGPARHSRKKRTATMGGLFFVPIGVAVAKYVAGFSSIEVSGASAATLAFAIIGLIDDISGLIKNHSSGLSAWLRLTLELAVGAWFWVWLNATRISSPYGMYSFLKMLIPLPAPLGLLYLGKFYLLLTSFTFVSMANGINLTDGLDGLAAGTAALSFIGMSIAVLPICSALTEDLYSKLDLSIFGASMAGACVGFLLHNRYRASVFMGDTGSLALGGALAAMAACTGMFFPLLVSSGIFVVEASSVIMQVLYFKTTRRLHGAGRRLFRMAPFHHHLELCGFKEPMIVAGAYVISSVLALFAGYVGLISA